MSYYWYSKAVKIPEMEYYVIHKDYVNEKEPLSFMVPYGVGKDYQRRKETADNWANDKLHRHQNKPTTQTGTLFNNTPISGFRLTFDIRNGYKGSPDAWRIYDPRGFVIEIRSNNLAQLMKYTKIENGEIAGDCVWGRDGAHNVLLSVNTEDYKEAAKNSVGKKAGAFSIKKVAIGDEVILDNGYQGRYMGYMKTFAVRSYGGELVTMKPFHIFYGVGRKDVKNEQIYNLYLRKDVRVSQIVKNDALTASEAEAFVNERLNADDVSTVVNGYNNPNVVMTDGIYNCELEQVMTLGEYLKKKENKQIRYNEHLFCEIGNNFYYLNADNGYNQKPDQFGSIIVSKDDLLNLKRFYGDYYNRTYHDAKQYEVASNPVYKLKIKFLSTSGSVYTRHL